MAYYHGYEHLYTTDRDAAIATFHASNPHFSDYEGEMERYDKLETEISELLSHHYLNPAIRLSVEPLKLALAVEAKAWKTAYGHSLNERYRSSMENIVKFVNDYSKKLARPIKVLVCCIMQS